MEKSCIPVGQMTGSFVLHTIGPQTPNTGHARQHDIRGTAHLGQGALSSKQRDTLAVCRVLHEALRLSGMLPFTMLSTDLVHKSRRLLLRGTSMEPVIRRASEPDTQEIERIVSVAYKHYVSRIGKPPAPMSDDYRELVCHGNVWVLTLGAEIAGLVVLKRESDYMLLDNVAVKPEHQGSGFGRQLIEFAEARARQCGYDEIQLYTNALMHENLAMYARLGYQEFSRRGDSGFDRVFFRKSIRK